MPDYVLTPTALADLFRDRGDDLLAWFARRTWDREAAVDLTAESFARAVASRERFRGGSRAEAEAWLFGIAGNVLRRYVRKGRSERNALHRLGMEPPTPTPDDLERIVRDAALAELRATIGPLLEALPDKQRRAVRMRIVEELSYAEIAARTRTSPQTVRSQVSRGLHALKAALPAPLQSLA